MCVYVYVYTVEVKSFHTPCRICKMLIILPSKRDHTKCYYCLFSTDLNNICHIKMFRYSPQEKILVEFIKRTLFKSLA